MWERLFRVVDKQLLIEISLTVREALAILAISLILIWLAILVKLH